MRSRISGGAGRFGAALTLAAVAWLAVTVPARGAASDVWPTQVPPLADETALNGRLAGLQAAAASLPSPLAPTIRFEEAFLRIMARVGEPEWLPAVRALADAPGADPVTAAVRDVARSWVARVQMRGIDAVLDDYYAQNVRFPTAFAEVEKSLPRELKTDPWGEPWTYRVHAPEGFSRQALQRYALGPKRWPALGTLREATVARPPLTPPAWKITAVRAGEGTALEFRAGAGGAVLGLIQAGGRIDAYTLVYIGDRWALLAGPDQLFTVTF